MNKFYNFLGLAKRSGNLLEGYNKCNENKNRINIFLMIISIDASESSKRKFKNYCAERNIPLIEDFTKEQLGDSLGREELKILAISDKNMAEKLLFLYQNEKGTN